MRSWPQIFLQLRCIPQTCCTAIVNGARAADLISSAKVRCASPCAWRAQGSESAIKRDREHYRSLHALSVVARD
eukprot:3313591-Pleurochrysis_carterae.AAC.3